jgi:hypothetical protein
MTEALFGLLGVLVGGVLGGGVQVAVAARERRQEARAAARLVFRDLWLAQDMLEAATRAETWWDPGFAIPLDDWRTYRKALASALPAEAWTTVDGAFHGLRVIEDARRQDVEADADDHFEAVQERIPEDLERIVSAMDQVMKHGFSWRERRKLLKEPGEEADTTAE